MLHEQGTFCQAENKNKNNIYINNNFFDDIANESCIFGIRFWGQYLYHYFYFYFFSKKDLQAKILIHKTLLY